ncbi:hypothetical protein [Halarchaeum sp. P4]|uniref:hypothetical protein n=1 Tax=Halarchaeum sp. P4 TaxID=3421639 RepID=UPI003EBACC30
MSDASQGPSDSPTPGDPYSRPSADEFRAEIEARLTADLDADQRSYKCRNCWTPCLNPAESILFRARVCLDCHARYLSGDTR